MAVVHWQQPDPPEPEQLRRYLQDTWSLNPDELEIEALSTPWFREGGHQMLTKYAERVGLATTNPLNPQGRKVSRQMPQNDEQPPTASLARSLDLSQPPMLSKYAERYVLGEVAATSASMPWTW